MLDIIERKKMSIVQNTQDSSTGNSLPSASFKSNNYGQQNQSALVFTPDQYQ